MIMMCSRKESPTFSLLSPFYCTHPCRIRDLLANISPDPETQENLSRPRYIKIQLAKSNNKRLHGFRVSGFFPSVTLVTNTALLGIVTNIRRCD